MLLLDTNVLLPLTIGTRELGKQTRQHIEQALREERLAVPAIVFLEAGFLQRKKKIPLDLDLSAWRQGVLDLGVAEIAICGDACIRAAFLQDFHPDPWDRLIVATALHHNAGLATFDEAILRWKGGLKCLNARR